MKDLKKKLTAAAAMLVVSAVMLSGVSYAWYTLSTNPEVSNIKANIAANENLEIALDNGYAASTDVDNYSKVSGSNAQGSTKNNPYTWGNLVDLKVAMDRLNPTTGKKLVLAPVRYNSTPATGSENLEYPVYHTDGRVDSIKAFDTPENISDLASISGDSLKGGVKAYSKDTSTYDAFSITYWLRSNENCNVTLNTNGVKRAASSNETATSNTDVNTVEGSGSYIEIPVSVENVDAKVKAYAKNLVVQLNVGDNQIIYAKLTNIDSATVSDGKIKFSLALDSAKTTATTGSGATNIALTANEAKKITTYVYVDGETVTNADALLDDISGMTMNLQFNSSEIGGTDESSTVTPGAMNGATSTTNP